MGMTFGGHSRMSYVFDSNRRCANLGFAPSGGGSLSGRGSFEKSETCFADGNMPDVIRPLSRKRVTCEWGPRTPEFGWVGAEFFSLF